MVTANPRGCFCGRGVKVSKEGAEKAAFVPTLSELLLDPCGGDAAWGLSQQVLATVARMRPHEDPRGLAEAGEAHCSHVL